MAITDLGNLCGALEFSRTAVKHGIKPILGLDAFLATGSRLDREQGGADNSLVLLAQNDVGFKNLIQLSTAGYTEGFHYRPRIDRQLLADHAAGLICLSGGTLGELTEAVLLEELDQAEKIARWYKGLFGTRYFIELQDHEYQSEHRATRTLIELANKLEIPTVASVSVRYVQRRQAEALDLLSCMLTAKFLSDPDRDLEQQNTFFLQSPQEVQTRFSGLEASVLRTQEIADSVTFNLADHVKQTSLQYRPGDFAADDLSVRQLMHGEKQVARLGRIERPSGRQTLFRVMRALGIPPALSDQINELAAQQPAASVRELFGHNLKLRTLKRLNPEVREIVRLAEQVDGIAWEIEPDSGVLVSQAEIAEQIPLMRTARDGELVTQWSLEDLQLAGYLQDV